MSTNLAIKHSRNGGTERVENLIRNREPFQVASVTAKIARGWYDSGRLQGPALEQWHADITKGVDYVVYSYGTPIAWHKQTCECHLNQSGQGHFSACDQTEGEWTLVFDKFSPTTTQHQSRVRSALSGRENGWGDKAARPAIWYSIAGRG